MPTHRGDQRKDHRRHRCPQSRDRDHHNNSPVEVGVVGNTWGPEEAVRSPVDRSLEVEERLRNDSWDRLPGEEIERMELAKARRREGPGRDPRLDE